VLAPTKGDDVTRGGEKVDLELLVEAGHDREERDELTTRLRRELLELDVAGVRRGVAGDAPEGAKAVDVAAVGTLIVTVAQTAPAIVAVVDAVRSWLGRRRPGSAGSVKLRIGDAEIEVTGEASPDQQRLIAAWLERCAKPSSG
jgi:hypothetical protein